MQFTRVNGINLAFYVSGSGGVPVLMIDLPTIHAPTLVIHGDADPLVPYANGQKLAARIPGAQLMTLAGCGHLAMWEQPEELARLLLSFLN